MTATSLVTQDRRAHASAKRPLRLPIIAPKEEHINGKLDKSLIAPPRIRLPPRSRTGCWTCRSRKVKCDEAFNEGHAQCNQCTRLGHICDFRPRLAFRDDTSRIIGRMSDVNTVGNSVWDLSSPANEDKSEYFSTGDSLPAFAFLTSDEERERKAEASIPGTYYVIVIPDSFSKLPEYAADAAEAVKSDSRPNLDSATDFDVVILETFEDITHRSACTGRTSRISPMSEASDPFCSLAVSPVLATLHSPVLAEDDGMSFLNPHNEQPRHDTAPFAHLRHSGWKQPTPNDRGQDDAHGLESCGMTLGVGFLEPGASDFPPLFDINDLYALLSGAGTEEFVRAIMDHQMLPASECLLYPSVPDGYSMIHPDEYDSLPVLMHLYAETFTLAARLGFLAAQLRKEKQSLPFADFDPRTDEIRDLRREFSRPWESSDVSYWYQLQDSLPRRSREMLQQSATLFHVCQLFSYSSMWPGQRLESERNEEIDHHVRQILRIAEQTTYTRRADRRFLVFPLFLAGATTLASGLKMMAMDLMTSMEDEEDGLGRNAATARAILQIIYERQLERLMLVGHTLDVDWAELMAQEGLQMPNFGFS